MNKRSSKNYKRIQFDLHCDTIKRLDNLVEETDAENRTEVVKRSLKLYEYVLQCQKKGGKFIIELNDDKFLIPPIVL